MWNMKPETFKVGTIPLKYTLNDMDKDYKYRKTNQGNLLEKQIKYETNQILQSDYKMLEGH